MNHDKGKRKEDGTKKYHLCEIRATMCLADGNSRELIYAVLRDEKGYLVISATLNYILAAIADRGYDVEGVSVETRTGIKGKEYKIVQLDKYEVDA